MSEPSRGGPEDDAPARACLITGASGFIGGALARRLARDGQPVRCLVRASSDTARLAELDVELVVGDLADADSLRAAVVGCDRVVHCAALVSDWATTQEIVRANVTGTRDLLAACEGASVRRFVHLSTTDVYGYPPARAAVTETYRGTRFRNWYAHTKRDAEAEVWSAARRGPPRVVVLRPATVYGPGSVDVVGEIARAIRGGHMLLVGAGRALAGLCYVENLLDAVVLALAHDRAPGQAFNVCDGLGVTWREFTDDLADGLGCRGARWSMPLWMASGVGFALEHAYRLLRRTTGLRTSALLSRQAVDVLGRDQDFSNRKLRETLGWQPRVSYAEGLAATLRWLREERFDSVPG